MNFVCHEFHEFMFYKLQGVHYPENVVVLVDCDCGLFHRQLPKSHPILPKIARNNVFPRVRWCRVQSLLGMQQQMCHNKPAHFFLIKGYHPRCESTLAYFYLPMKVDTCVTSLIDTNYVEGLNLRLKSKVRF